MADKLKVGILSPFYNNYNYGGKLQAYALTKILNDMGYDAEQISYSQSTEKKSNTLEKKVIKAVKSSDYRNAIIQKIYGKILHKEKTDLKMRKEAFDKFDQFIPHTSEIYNDQTIVNTLKDYDTYICGSDQIWNPDLYKKSYYLEFVTPNKYKFSYAASIAKVLAEKEYQNYKTRLKGLDDISVREKESQLILEKIIDRPVSLAVDPTLLLTKENWEEIIEGTDFTEKYIFCYFLGYNSKMRINAKKIAKELNAKIVTLPHLLGISGRFYPCDEKFGDEKLYNISPAQFLALVKGAQIVLTDSFHATVFSIVFQKQFIVFERIGFRGMNSRLTDLLNIFEMEDRLCNCNLKFEKLKELVEHKIIYGGNYEKFEFCKKKSLDYIYENMKKAEKRKYEK